MVPRKYERMDWKLASETAILLSEAGVEVKSEHVMLWRPNLAMHAHRWAERERMVRDGEHKARLACPSFLYNFYVPKERVLDLMTRGRKRAYAGCPRVKTAAKPRTPAPFICARQDTC